MCVGLAEFLVGTHRFLPCPCGGWRPLSPNSVNYTESYAAHDWD